MKKISIDQCSILELPKHSNRSGNITIVHNNENIPFNISRVFYSYDIPGGESRGAHAHKTCQQVLIAASGSFEIELNDGFNKKDIIFLNKPYFGLYIPAGIWTAQRSFSSGSICLVLASDKYDEKDYIRDYKKYLEYRNDT